MDNVTLRAVPSQTFSKELGGVSYDVRLKAVGEFMVCDVSVNNLLVIEGLKVVAGSPLIPYRYLQNGNFIFVTQDEEEPFYDKFGVTQYLYLATKSELEAITNGQ